MIEIRQATAEDAALIADLSRTTFQETFANVNTKENMEKFMRLQFGRERLMAEVTSKENFFMIAWEGTIPLGYAKLREGEIRPEFNGKATLELARIYAVKEAIGKGVGSALMKKCIELAKEWEKEILWLGVWEENDKAIQFYKKWGFEKFNEHEFILGDDVQTDWLMKKELNGAMTPG